MPAQWFTSEIVRIVDETPQTKRFYLKVQEAEHFRFTAGQFITFDLPIHEVKQRRLRSYSIASAPTGNNELELVIVKLEGGLGTTYLFEETKVGTQIPFMGPLGKFVLPPSLDREICFICTGTGIAPFRSMIWDIKNRGLEQKKIHLLFGTRTHTDILYHQEMTQLSQEMETLNYQIALSRTEPKAANECQGYVHQLYETIFSDRRAADFYLCGWKNMIVEAQTRLMEMGYDKTSIHQEIYG